MPFECAKELVSRSKEIKENEEHLFFIGGLDAKFVK